MKRIDDYAGDWALVTGASSGIGEAFARQLAAKKINLLLVARREEKLRELAQSLVRAHGIQARIAPLDLSREDFLPALDELTRDINVSVLVNNAGFGLSGRFLENDIARELEMLHLNCRAPLLLTHHYAAPMKQRGRGAIIFLSSILGHMPVPRMSHYAATKGYDLLLAEGLGRELESSGVSVMALCPGATQTEFSDVAGLHIRKQMSPDDVVSLALARVGKSRYVVPGAGNKAMVWLPRLLSRRLMADFMARAAGSLRRH